jgi:site-specific recombinase XerC
MAKHPDYPGVSSYQDRHGKTRWRFRKTGLKPALLPGEPGSKPFAAAYKAAIEGRIVKKAEVVRHPRAAHPASLTAAWIKIRSLSWWSQLDPKTQENYRYEIEQLLDQPAGEGKVGDSPCADLKPRHVRDIMDGLSASRARVLLTVLRRMMQEAIMQEWVEQDPTYKAPLPDRKDNTGHEAWPPHICAKFEARWPLGSTARTTYEMARWMGTRRSDIAIVRWDQKMTRIVDGAAEEGFQFVEHKGRRKKGAFSKFHPIKPMLAAALAVRLQTGETVLAKKNGQPYSMASLSSMMARTWAPQAGIEGYSLHGLRHAMGGMLADAEATLHESRDALGHADYKNVVRYNKSRDQATAATRGSRKVTKLVKG